MDSVVTITLKKSGIAQASYVPSLRCSFRLCSCYMFWDKTTSFAWRLTLTYFEQVTFDQVVYQNKDQTVTTV